MRQTRPEESVRTLANPMSREIKIEEVTRLLTADEVAAVTGLSVETLAQWRSQGREIPYLKIGRAVRYDVADVQSYLEGCRVSVSDPKERRQN